MLLLTGISGFVGENLARQFLDSGQHVVGTYLTHPITVPRADCVAVDLTDAGAVRRLLEAVRPTAVVHCASATKTGWCEDNPAEARAAIVLATQNLCEAIRITNPETPLVAFSTDLVFDGESAPYNEGAGGNPLNVYGKLKFEAENFVKDLPFGVVLRSALVYGPPATKGASFLQWIASGLARRQPVTLFEDEWRTPVFVDDLASAVSVLLANARTLGSQKIFHAGGPDRLSRVEMGEIIARKFGLPADTIVPSSRADVTTGGARARDVSLSCTQLHKLGWRPHSFESGIESCLQRWERT